jgi:hypothetical protein
LTNSTEERNASAKAGGLAATKVVLTADVAGVVADISTVMYSQESLCGRMMVARVLKADLQHFV